jgi:hypothetical protein
MHWLPDELWKPSQKITVTLLSVTSVHDSSCPCIECAIYVSEQYKKCHLLYVPNFRVTTLVESYFTINYSTHIA